MASSGNFPAMMTDEVVDMISGLEGFPTDEASKEALTVSNLYLEVPYAPNVSEIMRSTPLWIPIMEAS